MRVFLKTSHRTAEICTWLGDTNDVLYELNPDTGEAERVGDSTKFGQNRSDPAALASFGSPAELYALFYNTPTVYRLNTTTGAATSVADASAPSGSVPEALNRSRRQTLCTGPKPRPGCGSCRSPATRSPPVAEPVRSGFGVNEDLPGGIAAGYTRPSGYEIGSSTGTITYTGSSAPHGVYTLYAQVRDVEGSDDSVAGSGDDSIAGSGDGDWDDTVPVTVVVQNRAPSFSAGNFSYEIAPGSDGRITPVAVGSPSAMDPEGQSLTYSLRASDPSKRMYMTGYTTSALYALDSTTGIAARVGGAVQFGVAEDLPRGMAWHNGQLYMIGAGNDSLYTLDIVTGVATLVADKQQITGSSGLIWLQGLASHGGELYLTTILPARLYRVDLDTLTGTRIGEDGFGSVDEEHPYDIASHGSPAELYMIGAGNDRLYTLDTASGAATRVGTNTQFGLDYEFSPVALASHDDSLYMTGTTDDHLYRLDTITGAATRVGSSNAFGIGEPYASGIATGYSRPEGFTVNADTGEILYIIAAAEPGVHTLYVQVSDGRDAANAADSTVDDTALVVVTVPNRAPSFAQDSYEFTILPGTDGSVTAQAIGTAAASDPDGDTVSYSLRAADPPGRMYMAGTDGNALLHARQFHRRGRPRGRCLGLRCGCRRGAGAGLAQWQAPHGRGFCRRRRRHLHGGHHDRCRLTRPAAERSRSRARLSVLDRGDLAWRVPLPDRRRRHRQAVQGGSTRWYRGSARRR